MTQIFTPSLTHTSDVGDGLALELILVVVVVVCGEVAVGELGVLCVWMGERACGEKVSIVMFAQETTSTKMQRHALVVETRIKFLVCSSLV